jgi:hypothetical protein
VSEQQSMERVGLGDEGHSMMDPIVTPAICRLIDILKQFGQIVLNLLANSPKNGYRHDRRFKVQSIGLITFHGKISP